MTKHWLDPHTNFWRPTWDNVIDNLNACPKKSVDVLDDLGAIAYEVVHKDYMPVLDVARQLSDEYAGVPVSALTFISFTSNSKTFGKHNDTTDVYILQALGIVEVKVWEDEQEYTYNLTPGQLIHIPKGLYHDTKPLTPRVSISYGIEE